ncbi:hypothetical protein V6N11_028614 [Hibiscus sabdariffa]|uniref:Trehalose-phosphatase n=1 Tax=Hibiscus sabdariffa TaxID=183260 RepID=A0ABR2PQS9_9ROSI
MVSSSCINLSDLASGDMFNSPPRRITRAMTDPGIVSKLDAASSGCREKKIIVANFLPLQAQKDINSGGWLFSFDDDSLLLQMKDGFSSDTDVVYVGSLKKKFYHGFCKKYLWSLFHYMLPMCPDYGNRFDRLLWQAYLSANKIFAEKLLQQHPELKGNVVLVQIVNPARSSGKDVQEAKTEIYESIQRINNAFGFPGYEPVVLIDRHVPFYEKLAYYAFAECCIVNAVRDGMNLVPYKYIVCRQGTSRMDEALQIAAGSPRTSMLVVSEFIGCSPSLSGAIRVNPWNIDAVADALYMAITIPDFEKQLRHEKHYRYVSSHDVAYWARSFMQDLERACKEHYSKNCWGIGFGLSFRVLSLSPSFRQLSKEDIVSAHGRTCRRAIFLDYDGTLVRHSSITKSPSPEVILVLNNLCSDPKNTVFIVSGRGKNSLSDWFAQCENLGIAAEHGYFIRWCRMSEWETFPGAVDFGWKKIAEPVMKLYTETTDGSYIESKESALVWHHQNAHRDFGSCQAKELLDHLESVLANEPVVIKRGRQIVELNPQGVTKGFVTEKILSTMTSNGKPPDFVLCIGDDRSDEDMFESISNAACISSLPVPPEIFACTVGQKPSKARYYLDDTVDVLELLRSLTGESDLSSSFRALNHQCNLIRVRPFVRVRIYALESYLQEVQQPLITCTLRDQGLVEGFSGPFPDTEDVGFKASIVVAEVVGLKMV